MRKELEMWRTETQLNAATLETEERSDISFCIYYSLCLSQSLPGSE